MHERDRRLASASAISGKRRVMSLRHRRLACRLVAVGWRAVLMVAKAKRPHPRRTLRRGGHLHDAADDGTIGEHVEVVVVPLAGRTGGRGALEDQIVLVHFY